MKTVAVSVAGYLMVFLSSVAIWAAEPVPIPKEALQEMEYRVGTWECSLVLDGNTQPSSFKEVTEWAPGGRYCLIVQQSGIENGVNRHGTAIVGWDPNTKQLVERWHVSDGMCLSYHYNIDKEKNAWVGTVKCSESDGKYTEGKSIVQKKSNDEWTWKGTWTEDGKERTRAAVSRRVKKVRVSNYDRLKDIGLLVGE